jgi:hypothetical protein
MNKTEDKTVKEESLIKLILNEAKIYVLLFVGGYLALFILTLMVRLYWLVMKTAWNLF